MSQFIIRPFAPEDSNTWDAFCESSPMGTFLHTRNFLSYHGDRFQDQSLLIEDARNGIVGVFPAAREPTDPMTVSSHPGITYGGMVHRGELRGESMIRGLRLVADHFASAGYRKLRYKAVPHIYQCKPSQDDLYALFRLGAMRSRCELSCTIDLSATRSTSGRRRRGQSKARRAGVKVEIGSARFEDFWQVLSDNLLSRHGTAPVHSLDEILLLHRRFPDAIHLATGLLDGHVVAGVMLFDSAMVSHAQYIASSEEGRSLSALDLVFEDCIERAAILGKRYFDFGISNTDGGLSLNSGLHSYKCEFGGGGTVHELYEVAL